MSAGACDQFYGLFIFDSPATSLTAMSQVAETTLNSPPATTTDQNIDQSTGKRRREGDNEVAGEFKEPAGEEPSPKRRAISSHDVLFRIVVPSRQIGKVIGKEGYRIKKIREESKATIKIADAIAVSCPILSCTV